MNPVVTVLGQVVPGTGVPVPLSVFPILLLILGAFLFVLAAVGMNPPEIRERLVAGGLACWVLYILLQLIGGLVR